MNVSKQISDIALKHPDKLSVVCPKKGNKSYVSYSFSGLESRINQFSNRLEAAGVTKGDKVLVFIKPNIDFAAIVFSIFKIEAIGVFIDPGMGKDKLLTAIEESKANVLIGVNKVHILRRVFKSSFKNIRVFLTNSKSSFFAESLYKGLSECSSTYPIKEIDSNEIAALLYTSGGTGKPKGVIYTHQIFIEQTKKLQKEFNLTHEDVDLAGFPLFAMFTLSMGMTSVIPYMDAAKPALAIPKALVKNIKDHNITFAAGSPAIWSRMVDMCIDKKTKLESIKYFVMFGAPVSYETHLRFSKILPNGSTYTPYGATECLPVSNISGEYILSNWSKETFGSSGICVGFPLDGVDVKVVELVDGNMTEKDLVICPHDKVGEIIVSSDTVTKGYYGLSEKTSLSKVIYRGRFYHRMGDTGYFDKEGRLWFTGRVAHSFKIGFKEYFPIPVEQLFLALNGVYKAAYVKVDSDKTALVIEGTKNSLLDIKNIVYEYQLKVDHILFHPKFPVDIRHNIKIDRSALAKWAKDRL